MVRPRGEGLLAASLSLLVSVLLLMGSSPLVAMAEEMAADEAAEPEATIVESGKDGVAAESDDGPAIDAPLEMELTALGSAPSVVELNNPVDVSLSYGDSWIGSFTAPSSGIYVFSSTGEYHSAITLYSDAELLNELTPTLDDSNVDNFWVARSLSEGETAYFEVAIYHIYDDPVSFSVTVSRPTMLLGERYDVSLEEGERWRALFEVPEDGLYSILLPGTDAVDGEMNANSNWNTYVGHYKIGKVTLAAGDVLDLTLYGKDYAATSFSVSIVKGIDIGLAVPSYNGSTIFVADGNPHSPEVRFPFGPGENYYLGKSLEEGTDYVVSYLAEDGSESSEAPSQPGNYQVVCTGIGEYGGKAYVPFEIREPEPAKEAAFGVTYQGTLTPDDWYDRYKVELPTGGRLVQSVKDDSYSVTAALYDSSGMYIAGDLRSYALTKGTYYYVIKLDDGDGPYTYSVSFSFNDAGESFPEEQGGSDGSVETANPIRLNTVYRGQVTLQELTDFYRFSMPAAGQVTLVHMKENAMTYNKALPMDYVIYDASGAKVWSGKTYGSSGAMTETSEFEQAETFDLEAGNYYLEASRVWDGIGYYGIYEFELWSDVTAPVVFSDVTDTTAHGDDIAWLAAEGISKGWDAGDGTTEFRPYANVARADMAAFLFRLAKSWGLVDESWQPSGTASFLDVTTSTAHYREILWLAESGISRGWDVSGGKEFRPYANVARADMAAFLQRLQALREQGSPLLASGSFPFLDVTEKTAHHGDILWLAESGISRGWDVPGGKEFRPYANVARADMAAFLHRMDALG